jgi:hypothetical protein
MPIVRPEVESFGFRVMVAAMMYAVLMYDERKLKMKFTVILYPVLLIAELLAAPQATAQSSQNSGYGVGNIHQGLVVGVIAGVAAAAGVGITYLILHNRGVVVGCITESGGRRTLVRTDKKVYSLVDTGPALPVGERAKLKGRRSGPASAPSFQVEKVLRDYGRCQP